MLYRTTKDFLVQFGLSDLSELPSLKELEEISKGLLGEGEITGCDDAPQEATSEASAVENTGEVSLEQERSQS